MKKSLIIIFIFAIIIGVVVAYRIYTRNLIYNQIAFETEYQNVRTNNTIKEAENLIKETSTSTTKTTPNTRVIERIYYSFCGHLVQNEEKIDKKLINKAENEFQIEYTSSEIIVYKEIYDYCHEHYLVKDVEGEIIIYGLDRSDNIDEVIRETGIQTRYLSDTDIQNLKNGIKVIGNKELNSLIEDFE